MQLARRLAGLVAAALIALAGYGTAQAQNRGGSVTLGVEQDIPGFDPLIVGVYDTGARAASTLIFNTLTRLDDDGKTIPNLALSWSVSADQKDWTFKLRPGVKFQDGTPFNAEAVAFNFRRMLDPDNHCRCAAYLTGIRKVEVVDDLTITFRGRYPSVNAPALFAVYAVTTVIHSPTAIKTMGEAYNHHPVGTGPFRVKSWNTGDALVLERNPDYWEEGHPYLDQVIVKPLPDPTARFAALESGDVDIIWHDIPADILKAKENPKLKVREYAGSGASEIVFNLRKPPLDDLRVRQALSMALDMEGFSESFTLGLYKPAMDPYGPGSFVKCKDPGRLPFDPEKAKALLKDYGKPVTVKLMITAEPRGYAIGQIFQQFWKDVGVETVLDPVDQTTFVTKMFQHDFEVGGWRIIDLADPSPQMYANFHTGSPVNLAGYSNPEVDQLLEAARSTPDEETRSEEYCKIAQILNHDVPWLWALQSMSFSIAKAGLEGVHKQFSDNIDLSDAYWAQK
jgi:peptide/nickel transport system substrate-binding protein